MRFLTPILFFAAALYVDWHNNNQANSILMFPFIDTIYPKSQGDPRAMGEASEKLLLVLGGLFMVRSVFATYRYRRHLRRNMAGPR